MRNRLGSLDLTDTGLSTACAECVDLHAFEHYTSLTKRLLTHMYCLDSVSLFSFPFLFVSPTISPLSPPPIPYTLHTTHEFAEFFYFFSPCMINSHTWGDGLELRKAVGGVCVACSTCLGCLNTLRTLHVSQCCSPP